MASVSIFLGSALNSLSFYTICYIYKRVLFTEANSIFFSRRMVIVLHIVAYSIGIIEIDISGRNKNERRNSIR